MFKWARHISRIIKVGYTLSKHDALIDMLDLFGDRPKALSQLSKFNRKHDVNGKPETRLVIALQDLGPSFIKIGQALATRPDIIGPEVALDLLKLQDNVPPFPESQARDIIEDDLGASIEELFDEFEKTPIAAAFL
jgi:ubiquinone biosynthesis protein